MRTIAGLKDELRYLYSRAQLSPWMLGQNMNDFRDILPGDESQPNNPDERVKCEAKNALVDFIYQHPDEWMNDYKFIIDGGVDEGTAQKGSSRSRKLVGATILTSGMIHVCQSQIYNPDSLGFHIGFANFMSSVKSWSEAGETITLLSEFRFLFVSEVYMADNAHSTLATSVAEAFNDLLERRENRNLVTILSIKPSAVSRIQLESNYLGAALKSWVEQAGKSGSTLLSDKRLCHIVF